MRFDRITRLNIKSRSFLSAGYVRGKKLFVKKYTVRKGKERDDMLKARCEQLCYLKLGNTLNLPRLIEADYKNRVLVLDFVKFRKARASAKTIDDILNFHSSAMARVDASFLPGVRYNYYAVTLRKLTEELNDRDITRESDRLFNQFEKNRKIIARSAKRFSHGDLRLENVKYFNKRMTVIDLEHSRNDNSMVDLACLYVDLYGKKSIIDVTDLSIDDLLKGTSSWEIS